MEERTAERREEGRGEVRDRGCFIFAEVHLCFCVQFGLDLDPPGIISLVHRYRYLDLWPCDRSELESFGNWTLFVCLFVFSMLRLLFIHSFLLYLFLFVCNSSFF